MSGHGGEIQLELYCLLAIYLLTIPYHLDCSERDDCYADDDDDDDDDDDGDGDGDDNDDDD